MKQLLIKLANGVYKKELSSKELKLLSPFFHKKILKNQKLLKLNSDYRIGYIDIIKKSGIGFLEQIATKGRDLLIEKKNLGGAKDGDLVVAKKLHRKRGRLSAKVVLIVQKNRQNTICYVKKIDDKILAFNIDDHTRVTLHVKQKTLKQFVDFTVLKIDESGQILEVLGNINSAFVDEKIVLAKYNRHEEFEANSIKEIRSFGDSVDKTLYPKRIDLTALEFITIDPKSAKDFDDALYYDKDTKTLFVAIADVSEYVFAYSSLDSEAKRRGFSIYFPHKSIPMLPRNLSENLCSLNPNEDRLAFVFKMKLDEKHTRIKSFELFEAIINSKRRYTYERVDEILEGANKDEIDEKIFDFLTPLISLTQKFREKRLKNGFDFKNEEIRMQLDSELNLVSTYKEEQTISHQLVEECMLLANKCAATFFNKGIFRTHLPPDFKGLNKLKKELRWLGIEFNFYDDLHEAIKEVQEESERLNIRNQVDMLIIKSLKRAEYSYKNFGHFGLGFQSYTHFTSPIRRYSDLILHRLLKTIIYQNNKEKKYLNTILPLICEEVTKLENETTKVEWSYKDRVYARWAKNNIDKICEAFIVDAHPRKDYILKLDTPIAGARVFAKRENNKEFNLFEKVQLKITSSDIITTKIEGQILEKL